MDVLYRHSQRGPAHDLTQSPSINGWRRGQASGEAVTQAVEQEWRHLRHRDLGWSLLTPVMRSIPQPSVCTKTDPSGPRRGSSELI